MTEENVLEALKNVTYPGFTKDIVTFGFVKDIQIIDEKNITLTIDITSSADEVKAQINTEATAEMNTLGFEHVGINIVAPTPPKQISNSVSGKNIAPHVKSFVMVSSGKGGVGKSTTSVNLAVAMAMQGKKVGLLDADIYGPNIPRMMGVHGIKPEIQGNKLQPLKSLWRRDYVYGVYHGRGCGTSMERFDDYESHRAVFKRYFVVRFGCIGH